jgi:hypothetical protein
VSYEYVFACEEPEGVILRYVRPLEAADIPVVYQRIRESFHSRGKDALPWEAALKEFMRLDKLYWTVDDVGLIIANRVGDVHIFFWDKRLRGRERMCKAMALVIMEIFDRTFVWTEIPKKERAVLAFAKRVGFKETAETRETVTLHLAREVI